ncbi:MAG TPA: hypothetical protein VKR31_16365 [Rhizomicrobium sp.]|nr:hypothetical protein [Rhizomicrobium sp.]
MPFFQSRLAPRRARRPLSACIVLGLLCSATAAAAGATIPQQRAGLGKALTTKDGGQIYGFDIDQNGSDGVLASAGYQGNTFFVSVETFDQDTGKIKKSFATKNSARNSYSVDGIFAGDVGLVTHYVVPKGSIYAKREYDVLNPVTANGFTGTWTSPISDIDIKLAAENQSTTTGVVYAIELKKQDDPVLVVSDIGANTVSKVIRLDPNSFSLSNGPQLGEYSQANQAVMAESPDGGAVGGDAPLMWLFDMTTGKNSNFAGYNNGPYHAGDVNGLATDPATGVTATDTELNAQVEFYDMAHQTGIAAVQLPCTNDTDQTFSGSVIAVDPVNQLFLVTEPANACDEGADGAIIVYDESGNYVETISGFHFASDVVQFPPPALNPSKRMGWAFAGNGVSQLQQFFY